VEPLFGKTPLVGTLSIGQISNAVAKSDSLKITQYGPKSKACWVIGDDLRH